MGGQTGDVTSVLLGVPQSTVLGPLLLCYINDLPTSIKSKSKNVC